MRALAVLPIAAVLACASAPARPRAKAPLAELLPPAPAGGDRAVTPPVDDGQVLGVSPEMKAFLGRHVTEGADGPARLRQLGQAILDAERFGLRYDETTRTAAETFRLRRGNCLSFSSLFVALARELGLQAYYQEVEVPADWSLRDDSFVLNRHVNVVVDLGRGSETQARLGTLLSRRPAAEGEHVVDFNMDDFRTTYDRRRISDARAMAHFHNNVAVEHMQAGDAASAFASFRRAVERDASFAPAWTNLGILYARGGDMARAEAAYLQALAADKRDLVAMSNLASLYERTGRKERALEYHRRVARHRNTNPYYRFQLAREALQAGAYDIAIGHLRYAIDRKRNEDQFYFLLGLSYLRKGNTAAARSWFERAAEIAATDALRRRYASKIDLLLSGRRRH